MGTSDYDSVSLSGNMESTNVYSVGTTTTVRWFSDGSVVETGFSCVFNSGKIECYQTFDITNCSNITYCQDQSDTSLQIQIMFKTATCLKRGKQILKIKSELSGSHMLGFLIQI